MFAEIVVNDETTVEVRLLTYKNWNKRGNGLLRAAGGKLGKAKHSGVKIHLLRGISRQGLSPLVLFTSKMCSVDFQFFDVVAFSFCVDF